MRGPVLSREGMVASAHPLASMVGLDVLRAGGNAMDAAVAVAAMLNVVDPAMTGIGGDMFLLHYRARDGQITALNGSGRAPAAASVERIRALGHARIPAHHGLAVSVPGALDGWVQALERHGTMTLAELLGPAIRYAEAGFPVFPTLVRYFRSHGAQALGGHPDSVRTYFVDGRPPRLGEPLVQPGLAASLRTIAAKGPDVFYRGELGGQVVAAVQAAGGLLTADDLAGHRGEWVEPLSTSYRGFTVVEMPPPSQGVALLEQLNLLEGYDLRALPPTSGDLVHLQVQALKQAFADRDRYVTDPARLAVPARGLAAKAYAETVRSRIDRERASVAAPGDPGPHDTTYFAVVDREGNGVSFINSLRNPFGSGITAGDTGILLHNRAQDFSLDPGHANRIEPGKRTMHTLNPALVLREGRLYMVVGCTGAHQQTQVLQQFLVNHVDFGMDVQAAIDVPRWSVVAGTVHVEARMPEEVRATLAAKGHAVMVGGTNFGGCHAVMLDPVTGARVGGAESRTDAAALGY